MQSWTRGFGCGVVICRGSIHNVVSELADVTVAAFNALPLPGVGAVICLLEGERVVCEHPVRIGSAKGGNKDSVNEVCLLALVHVAATLLVDLPIPLSFRDGEVWEEDEGIEPRSVEPGCDAYVLAALGSDGGATDWDIPVMGNGFREAGRVKQTNACFVGSE